MEHYSKTFATASEVLNRPAFRLSVTTLRRIARHCIFSVINAVLVPRTVLRARRWLIFDRTNPRLTSRFEGSHTSAVRRRGPAAAGVYAEVSQYKFRTWSVTEGISKCSE